MAAIAPPEVPAEGTDRLPVGGSGRRPAAVAGVAAGAAALAAGELAAGAPSSVVSVGDRVDDGVPAPVEDTGTETLRQWILPGDAAPGRHRIRRRATDGDGARRTEGRTSPMPGRAARWHTIVVTVEEPS